MNNYKKKRKLLRTEIITMDENDINACNILLCLNDSSLKLPHLYIPCRTPYFLDQPNLANGKCRTLFIHPLTENKICNVRVIGPKCSLVMDALFFLKSKIFSVAHVLYSQKQSFLLENIKQYQCLIFYLYIWIYRNYSHILDDMLLPFKSKRHVHTRVIGYGQFHFNGTYRDLFFPRFCEKNKTLLVWIKKFSNKVQF